MLISRLCQLGAENIKFDQFNSGAGDCAGSALGLRVFGFQGLGFRVQGYNIDRVYVLKHMARAGTLLILQPEVTELARNLFPNVLISSRLA